MLTPHLQIALASLQSRAPHITEAAFTDALADAVVHPVDVDGRPVGAVIVKGPEIHACIACDVRGLWMSKWLLRLLGDVVRKHGHAITRATTDEGRQFVQRLGFVRRGDSWVMGANHGL